MKEGPAWSPQELAILHYLWTSGATPKQLQTALPNRSLSAIYLKRQRLNLPTRYLKITSFKEPSLCQ